jgi:hypothetical protein
MQSNFFSRKDLGGVNPDIFMESLRNANGYYTPDISDIRIGYECETRVEPYPNWVVSKIENVEDIDFIYNKEWEVRTPFLTKEQIEAEGWISKMENFYEKEGWKMEVYSNYIEIRKGSWYPDNTYFKGKCPSINEFRYICKLLSIK